MAIITEVQFAHDDGALAPTLSALESLDVRVLPETSTDPDRDMYVLAFENADADDVEAALARDHTVAAAHPLSAFEDRNLWRVEFAPETKLLGPRVTREGGFVIDARSARPDPGPRGWHERWLLPDRQAIQDIWAAAREAGFAFEVLELYRQGRLDTRYPVADAMTDEQRAALVTAHEMGYFADPREASLEAVADALDHSPSAVGGRIKRGMKSLIEATLVLEHPRGRGEDSRW